MVSPHKHKPHRAKIWSVASALALTCAGVSYPRSPDYFVEFKCFRHTKQLLSNRKNHSFERCAAPGQAAMMTLSHIAVGDEDKLFSRKEWEVPNLILAAVAWLYEPRPPRHDNLHARIRSRDATRRLRASRVHEPYVDLSCLDLSRARH